MPRGSLSLSLRHNIAGFLSYCPFPVNSGKCCTFPTLRDTKLRLFIFVSIRVSIRARSGKLIKSLYMLVVYNILLKVAALFVFPYYGAKMLLTGKYRKGLGQRFGLLKPEIVAGMIGVHRIWVHAVSVGEVTAAAPIIASLRRRLPDACIVLSTTTATGQEMAHGIVTGTDNFIYYPLDIPFVIRRVINAVQPDIFVLTETELWPNFIRHCRCRGVKVIMVNGRLSSRSFRRYALTRFFWKFVLKDLDGVGVISETDARRFRS